MIANIEALLKAHVQEDGPGVGLVIIQNGEVLHRQGYGLANLEWQIPIQADTVFRLASITKQFTAMAIMMLQEQDKLHVDDPLSHYLPDYPTSGHDIRIHHLLTHTSGIKSYTSLKHWFPNEIMKDMSPKALSDVFSQIPFDFKPGTQHSYNNSGYHLLGMIIEAVAEMDYATFIQTHIFAPLGMKNSHYMSNETIIKRRANGYDPSDDGFRNAPYLSMTQPYAAGALGSTLDDLVLWDQALRTHTLVRRETQALMWTPVILADGTSYPYGFGWGIGEYDGQRMVHHSGGIHGFDTFMVHFLETGLGLYLLANNSALDCMDLTLEILPILLNVTRDIPDPVTLSPDDLARFAGQYQMDATWTQEVIYEDGMLRLKDHPKPNLAPLDATHFYLVDQIDTKVSFTLDDTEQVTQINITSPFFEDRGKRIEIVS